MQSMQAKYGRIDEDGIKRIKRTVDKSVRAASVLCDRLRRVTADVQDRIHLGTEAEFTAVTGYDLAYFENVLKAIHAPKCSIQLEQAPEMGIAGRIGKLDGSEPTMSDHCNGELSMSISLSSSPVSLIKNETAEVCLKPEGHASRNGRCGYGVK